MLKIGEMYDYGGYSTNHMGERRFIPEKICRVVEEFKDYFRVIVMNENFEDLYSECINKVDLEIGDVCCVRI